MSIKEKPIVFPDPMIRAVLEGRKTQTRRAVEPQPSEGHIVARINEAPGFWEGLSVLNGMIPVRQVKYPYEIGMRLWVRETWRALDDYNGIGNTSTAAEIEYRADGTRMWQDIPEDRWEEMFFKLTPWVNDRNTPWRPSIFMPRWASRILLEITDVEAERLQDISWDDAIAEGIYHYPAGDSRYTSRVDMFSVLPDTQLTLGWDTPGCCDSPRGSFSYLWNRVNGKKSNFDWESNPWAYALTFRVLQPN